jgi:hypothetical protein
VSGSISPIFQRLAQQRLELAVLPVLIERHRQVFMMSSLLFQEPSETKNLMYMLDVIETAICHKPINWYAKL